MVCAKLDADLRQLARNHRCYYSRYADDLTFSTSRPTFPSDLAVRRGGWGASGVALGRPLVEAIESNGFCVNEAKTRMQFRDCHQEVTGLTVNGRRPNVSRRFVRQLRAMIHCWYDKGLPEAERRFHEQYDTSRLRRGGHDPEFAKVVRGKLDFLKMIRGEDDPVYRNLRNKLHSFAPEVIDELPRLRSCFISYGGPDLAMAQRLYDDLKRAGVACWFYRVDATAGRRTWEEIVAELRGAEKVLILCSIRGLLQDGVRKEIENQVDESSEKMLLLSLDNDWTHGAYRVDRGGRDLKPVMLERNYVDFADLEYEEAFGKLMKALRSAEIERSTLPLARLAVH
jgi:hypothetical protein